MKSASAGTAGSIRNVESVRRVAIAAVEQAGHSIVAIQTAGRLEARQKAPRDLVTAGDIESERIIITAIREAFPTDRIISEETFAEISVDTALQEPTWIIDPIDGTVNYANGHPFVGISVAFGTGGQVHYGIVEAPFLGRRYEAIRGQGAWENGRRLQCSSVNCLQQALVATGFPYERDDVPALVDRVRKILVNCQDLRRCGAASLDLCLVADGTFGAYLETVKPWDMAAGALIAREAGATVGWGKGRSSKLPDDICGEDLLVGAPGIYDQIYRLCGGMD